MTILIVEDDALVGKFFTTVLEMEGYAVVRAWTTAEARERLKTLRPDLILTDIVMPHEDGLVLVRELKSDPATKEIPIICVTAYTQNVEVENGILAGCDMYLKKPVSAHLLIQAIEEYLGRELKKMVGQKVNFSHQTFGGFVFGNAAASNDSQGEAGGTVSFNKVPAGQQVPSIPLHVSKLLFDAAAQTAKVFLGTDGKNEVSLRGTIVHQADSPSGPVDSLTNPIITGMKFNGNAVVPSET